MQISVNGDCIEINDNCSVSDLLQQYQCARDVVVLVNGTIVLDIDFDTIQLRNNDDVQLLSFLGGG